MVIIHVDLSFTHFNNGEIDERWEVVKIVESLVRWRVPIFVMILGVSKYIRRQFMTYICWNLFYYLCAYSTAYLRHGITPDLMDFVYHHGISGSYPY